MERGRPTGWTQRTAPVKFPRSLGGSPMMIPATQIRVGTLVIHNGELHRVHDMIHKTPGNLRGFVQVKMRNLRNGSMAEQRYGSTDRVEKASLDEREMEYLYSDSAGHHFMDQQSYDQVSLSDEVM